MTIQIKKTRNEDEIIFQKGNIYDLEIGTYKTRINISFKESFCFEYELTIDTEKTPDYEIIIRKD